MLSDRVRVDAEAGTLDALVPDFDARAPAVADLAANRSGIGREMFEMFRQTCGAVTEGAGVAIR